MHKNNKHINGYNLKVLTKVNPSLSSFIIDAYGKESVDFFNPKAVKALNRALLKAYYNISFWEFSDMYLCPPIPGRVDYIHHINDLLNESELNKNITVLDVGVGASCIYPLLGYSEYKWKFIGSECNKESIVFSENIINKNKLETFVSLREQTNKSHIFEGIVNENDVFSITMCNPPFYKNKEDAMQIAKKKQKSLGVKTGELIRNFSGQANELWYKGGEKAFLHTYLYESSLYKKQSFWFTILVSKKEYIKSMYGSLKKLKATEIITINMVQGNKKSRIVAWTFLTEKEQQKFRKTS